MTGKQPWGLAGTASGMAQVEKMRAGLRLHDAGGRELAISLQPRGMFVRLKDVHYGLGART